MRRGWTLHEMIISLAVTGAVLAIATHAALGQLRFFRGVGEVAALRGQLTHATLIPRALVWGASPAGGDIVVGQDTALEVNVVTGTAVVCESAAGWIIVPVPAREGNTLSAFAESPQSSDRIAALISDSTTATWLTFHVASAPAGGAGCPLFPGVSSAWTIALAEQVAIPPGAPLRFLRPMRLSLYRASDSRWYLGARDWNAETQRFNTIQPVAGPLEPPSDVPDVAGLRFEYYDSAGMELGDGVAMSRIAGIGVVARARSLDAVRIPAMATDRNERLIDSSRIVFALRNAR